MDQVTGWTGQSACALQAALRLTNEAFAEHLDIGVRTVASWHQKPSLRPKADMQQLLDTALERASQTERTRFADLITQGSSPTPDPVNNDDAAADAERRLIDDPHIGAALSWLDRQTARPPGASRRAVASRIAQLDIPALLDRGNLRSRVNQRQLVQALSSYYGSPSAPHGLYRGRFGGEHAIDTSILIRADWLDLDCPLQAQHDRLRAATGSEVSSPVLGEHAVAAAERRLAETLSIGTRLVDSPLYRLLDIDIRQHRIGGTVGIAPFVEYALTLDLLEGELTDAVATGSTAEPGTLPLRDRYLPDLASVLDVSSRLCAGGVLALCAFARPADPFRGDADYVLLVQERSGHVVNAARKLAVIPKGFHQPLIDLRADAQVGATLRREMEEELFGRTDVEGALGALRSADPMHLSRLSEPMRWLMEAPGRLRMECTGFGLNLVSGNYEFASLILVEDEEFWARYGGVIEANWESSSLQQYSTRDAEMLASLLSSEAWSNEGLFAIMQGLRRLAAIDGRRVQLPRIEWEIG